MTTEFVKGWILLDTLGEGRFGEVKLLMNKDSHDMVAVKVLAINSEEQDKQVKKEICIHKNIRHENIINFYGQRRDDESKIEYIFLEYAQNGELFEHIEPDIGMDRQKVGKIFIQLLNGIEYLHKRGIVHRDLKPENLLLDKNNCLKIADFGMATLFRHQGKERLLNQLCGSIPYMAPEVLQNRPHHAEPLDIWSCGIILVAMLTGELPWLEATNKNEEYQKWIKSHYSLHMNPWHKIDTITISLLKTILEPNPDKRARIERIRKHRAYLNFTNINEQNVKRSPTYKKRLSSINNNVTNGFASQPQRIANDNQFIDDNCDQENNNNLVESDNNDNNNWISYSQPNRIQDMFLSTQTQMEIFGKGSQGCTPPEMILYFRIVRRMTRFMSNKNFHTTIRLLEQSFEDLQWTWKRQSIGHYKIECNNLRIPLIFRSFVNDMSNERILVDFRLAKGDGIEFKRQFLMIKNLLKSIIRPPQQSIYDLQYDEL